MGYFQLAALYSIIYVVCSVAFYRLSVLPFLAFCGPRGRGFSEINIMTNATYVPRLNKMTCARSTLDIDKIEFCMETS